MQESKYLFALGRLEGFSLLVLVFLGMPMKYLAEQPQIVRIFGPIHGLLFLVFTFQLFSFGGRKKWKVSKLLFLVFLSCIPFGFFPMEKHIRQV